MPISELQGGQRQQAKDVQNKAEALRLRVSLRLRNKKTKRNSTTSLQTVKSQMPGNCRLVGQRVLKAERSMMV